MNGKPPPPTAPQAPMQGGRDREALQARATRRVERRVVGEQRQAGEAPVQRLPSHAPQAPTDAADVGGHDRQRWTWLRSTVGAVLRRPGDTEQG